MSLDLNSLWDFRQPALSEERFTAALASAGGDDELILHTQIARTWGLRRDFERARAILASIEPRLGSAGLEPRVRHALELGRSYVSMTHSPEARTPENTELARRAYLQAIDLAREAGLDNLAIDAMHMMVLVDSDPEDQIRWNRQALEVARASSQPDARRWEGSLLNNLGCAYWELGRNEDALVQFQKALELRERAGQPVGIRIAHWMVAKTLRLLGRTDEALAIQQRLEAEWAAANEPDPYVWEELELLHRARGEDSLADQYAAKRQAKQ